MTSLTLPSPRHPWAGLAAWLALSVAVAVIGGIASADAGNFYRQLEQPDWAPPARLFGPVWTVLYAAMAVAAWWVWRSPPGPARSTALVLYVVQLVPNALWSWLFFAWQQGALAMADIALLWLLIVATVLAFWRVKPGAAALLLPYLAWVSFAAALNFWLWRHNPALLG
ncbi:TspO/MBR family protein [Piscinibacter sp. HJYY11]|uniref:TspO/MBR family protein n=1 Tax=Piscinibacter sp. HJYY11 TaxID=2801333 RepID=UPI00191EE717|nr:TspO/MBR family protein [Piscinibacter sp. HJYY11]MBL0728238.1 tryptophan-rich sensory protein [Piscinibacter sp. HJYY11]